MTVAEALAAHASAQMAAARAADEARRMMDEIDREPVEDEAPSFIETWDVHATVIGVGH
jgi:hypothetical protein